MHEIVLCSAFNSIRAVQKALSAISGKHRDALKKFDEDFTETFLKECGRIKIDRQSAKYFLKSLLIKFPEKDR